MQANINKSQNISNSLLNNQDLKKNVFLLFKESWSHISKEVYSALLYHFLMTTFFSVKDNESFWSEQSMFSTNDLSA